MTMLKYLSLAFVLCAFLAGASTASATPLYVVDVAKVYSESETAKKADAHLAKVQAVLQKGFTDLEKRVEKAAKEERERELAAGRAVLERQMQIELQAAREAVHAVMLEAVKEWRKKKGGAVMAKQQLLDFSPKMEITGTIIKAMDKKTPKFRALPVVSFKDGGKKGK